MFLLMWVCVSVALVCVCSRSMFAIFRVNICVSLRNVDLYMHAHMCVCTCVGVRNLCVYLSERVCMSARVCERDVKKSDEAI